MQTPWDVLFWQGIRLSSSIELYGRVMVQKVSSLTRLSGALDHPT